MNFRNLAIWLVIMAALVVTYFVTQTAHPQSGGEISYSQLLRKVDNGEIKSADILQPGPAALTDGLAQLQRLIAHTAQVMAQA